MRHQGERRDSKSFVVVDEDCGIPTSLLESYRGFQEHGPLAQTDPRSLLLSMSEYDKSQSYDVYDYQPNAATRPEQAAQDYSTFAPHQTYPAGYVGAQAQVPSGLPQSAASFNPIHPPQQYGTHDTTYYQQGPVQYPAYVDNAPRPLPEIISYTPSQGEQKTKVTVYFRSVYDFDAPQVTPFIMFGQKQCQSLLTKTVQPGHAFQYALSCDAPPLTPTNPPSPQVSLSLSFDNSPVTWQMPSLEFGSFTYLDSPAYYGVESPQVGQKKRKLSSEASPRRSPTKKPSLHHLSGQMSALPSATPASPFRRPSVPEISAQHRRLSEPQPAYNTGLHRAQSQQFYGQSTPALQTAQSSSWNFPQNMQSTTRSPSAAAMSAGNRGSLMPSPAATNNPPLIRTSTLQSPTTPGPLSSQTQTFNPYAMYPSNSKALLKIDGDLNTMSDKWTAAEWETGRRLVQFRRTQSGSIITATFEPVTLEDRIPNSICVSCIWWEEKQECYVTSVDTISLLESLVAVRFTVEEKNRIRRNLEGFRPATVSKTKPDSEEFFKLIMGFPNPKPRNIEKDVKVFPWRILAGALKKIIGKYSASYSSTAGALHTPGAGPGYSAGRGSDASIDHPAAQRSIASPHSTSSSATSHGHAYAANAYTPHAAGLGIGPSAGAPLSLPATAAQTTSWHQPSAHYSNDLSTTTRGSWDIAASAGGGGYINASPATGLPSSAQSYQYNAHAHRIPSLTAIPTVGQARWVPLHQEYEHQQPTHQQTSSS